MQKNTLFTRLFKGFDSLNDFKNHAAIAVVVSSLLAGCAPATSSDDGPWASGLPDPPVASNPPIESPEQPPPSPSPSVSPRPSPSPSPTPTLPPPQAGVAFAMKPAIFQLAHGPGQTWNGCEVQAAVGGGYSSDTKCGNGTLDPAFAVHLNRHFMSCIDKAALAAGANRPERVFLHHLGTYVDRNAVNTTRLSMHAYARAIDLRKFILVDRLGSATHWSTDISAYTGANAVFYDTFRQCWADTMPSKCQPGQTEYRGSIGHTESAMGGNSIHADHIHLSFPLCAG